jgi:predicted N-acetyltransferase YhbS
MNLSTTTLFDRPDLFNQTISLIERSLQYSKHNSYAVDFYPLVAKRNHSNCHVIINEKDRVVAHIGFILKKIVASNSSIPVVLIGGVCVDKDYQGKGITHQFFQHLIQHYRKSNALAVLWSDLNDFYEKLDFYECGEIIQTGTMPLEPATLVDFQYREWSRLTTDEINILDKLRAIAAPKSMLLRRDEADWNDIKMINSCKLYMSKDSYFTMNKGQDLNGIIHEFGTKDIDAFINRFKNYKLWLYHSDFTSVQAHQKLYAGLFSIGDHQLFKELVFDLSEKEIASLEILSHNQILYSIGKESTQVSCKEFFRSLFGPDKKTQFKNYKSLIISGLESV